MVLLLNYLPFILTLVFAYFAWRYITKEPVTPRRILIGLFGCVAAIFLTFIILTAVSNSYIGKDDNLSSRLPTPTVEETEIAAQEAPATRDIQRKPELTSKEEFNEMTDWRAQKAEREKKVDTEK